MYVYIYIYMSRIMLRDPNPKNLRCYFSLVMLKIYLNSFSQLIHGKEVLNGLVTSEPNFLAPPASGSLILKLFRKPERNGSY
jgi:hypothetical protein